MTPQKGRGRLCFSPLGHTPGPPFFHPTARIFWFIWYLFYLVKISKGTKINVSGVMNVRPQTAAYRALNFVLRMIIELTPCPMPRKNGKYNFFLRHACTDL